MAEKDVVDSEKVFLAVGAGTFLTLATVFAVQGLYHWGAQDDFARKNYGAPNAALTANRERGMQQITTQRKLDGADKYAIPIDHAAKLVIQEAKTR
jgi:hypothetical protein